MSHHSSAAGSSTILVIMPFGDWFVGLPTIGRPPVVDVPNAPELNLTARQVAPPQIAPPQIAPRVSTGFEGLSAQR